MHAVNSKPVVEVVLGMNIGSQIRHWRKVKGLSQAELADLLKTGQPAIARVENDNYLPSLSFLLRVAEALGKSVQVTLK